MKEYIKLLRMRHYIKNLIIFAPMFLGGVLFDGNKIKCGMLGFVIFCMGSSAVYIWNDLRDIENDCMHPTKKNRPLASGTIKPFQGIVVMVLCICSACALQIMLNNIVAAILWGGYVILNVAYSLGLKNKPIVDIAILASGFVIRLFYGAVITNVEVSKWLYLVVMVGSLYMGLGKRRNELQKQTESRKVLKYYNVAFLDKNMYVCVAMVNVFYALWAFETPNPRMSWTIPVFIVVLMCYSMDVEGESDGDPVEVILHDKILLGMIFLYAICIFALLYLT